MKLNQSVFGTLSVALAMNLFAASAFSADACKAQGEVRSGDDAAKIAELNTIMKEVLAPFNDKLTVSEITYKRLATDPTRVTDFQVTAGYFKIGGKSDLKMKLGNLEYNNADPTCALPYAALDISGEFNVLAVISQKNINEFAPELEGMLSDLLKNEMRNYGDAGTYAVKVNELQKDDQGNVVAVDVSASASLDVTKLPASVKIEDVQFTDVKIHIMLGVKGFQIDGSVVLNPKNRYFGKDEPGMKEHIEKILARDPSEISDIRSFMRQLEDLYKQINE